MKNGDESIQIERFGGVLFDFSQRYLPETSEKVQQGIENLCERAKTDPVADELARRLLFNWKPQGRGHISSADVAEFATEGVSEYLLGAQGNIQTDGLDALNGIADKWRKKIGGVSKTPLLKMKITSKTADFALGKIVEKMKEIGITGVLGVARSVLSLDKSSLLFGCPWLIRADEIIEAIAIGGILIAVKESLKMAHDMVGAPEALLSGENNTKMFPLLPKYLETARAPRASHDWLADRSFALVAQVFKSLPRAEQMAMKNVNADALVHIADAVLEHIGPAETFARIEEKIKDDPKINEVVMNALVDQHPNVLNKAKKISVAAIHQTQEVMKGLGALALGEPVPLLAVLKVDTSPEAIMARRARAKPTVEREISAAPGLRM